jgi:diacylglycerol kinase
MAAREGRQSSNRREGKPRHSLAASFACAFLGVLAALHSERNLRLHFMAASLVLLFELVTRPSTLQALVILLCIFAVIAAELLNTAVECVIDLYSGTSPHPLARMAKDCAAGAVLVLAVASLVVAAAVAVDMYPWHWRLFSAHSAAAAILNATVLVALWITALAAYQKR